MPHRGIGAAHAGLSFIGELVLEEQDQARLVQAASAGHHLNRLEFGDIIGIWAMDGGPTSPQGDPEASQHLRDAWNRDALEPLTHVLDRGQRPAGLFEFKLPRIPTNDVQGRFASVFWREVLRGKTRASGHARV